MTPLSIHDTVQMALAIIERHHKQRVVRIDVIWLNTGPKIKVFAEASPPEVKPEDEIAMKG